MTAVDRRRWIATDRNKVAAPAAPRRNANGRLRPRILCVGGEDHELRIPFLQALAARGFSVTAAGTGNPTPFLQAGVDYRGFRFNRFVDPRADWKAIQELSQIIADIQPDIVQSFDTKPALLAPLAARRVADVLVIRAINGMGWLYSSRSPTALALRPAYRTLHRLAGRNVASTVFQNCADQRYFEQHRLVEPGKSVLIPGSGVDIEGFDHALRAAPPASQLRDALGLGASEIVITVTRLTRQKGISTLLKAAAIVNRERPAVRFLLVGPRESEGPLAISQAEIDRHAPYVIATGRRTDVPALLSLGAVFAFPTEYREGVPRALLEACLAGLPVVTTDVPGCSDVVRHGWSGFVVPQRSPRALAAAILELLIDRRTAQTMATRASAHVRQGFGLGTIVDRYAALYSQLLQSRLHSHPVGPVPSLPSDAPPANSLRSQASSA